MTIRNLELNDLEQVFNLLNELYEGKIQYDVFNKKYRNNLQDNNFYGILAEENDKITGVLISRLINRLAKSKDILYSLTNDEVIQIGTELKKAKERLEKELGQSQDTTRIEYLNNLKSEMSTFWFNISMLNSWKEDRVFLYQEEFIPVDISRLEEFIPVENFLEDEER